MIAYLAMVVLVSCFIFVLAQEDELIDSRYGCAVIVAWCVCCLTGVSLIGFAAQFSAHGGGWPQVGLLLVLGGVCLRLAHEFFMQFFQLPAAPRRE